MAHVHTDVVCHPREYLDFVSVEPLVAQNTFKTASPDRSAPPALLEVKHLLPQPFWTGAASAIACYWRVWELSFKNIRRVHAGNHFVAPYIDTAFNDCLFMWDSCFILMYCKYGARAFSFQKTLDNLYAKQHPDGFISREVTCWTGQDRFHRYDPVSTGPNILAWCEWEYFINFGDEERLRRVFPPLLAYHKWHARHRTWPDGAYHSCGLACGMDNQPRTLPGDNALNDHSFMAWIDATSQALISARLLVRMAEHLGAFAAPFERDVAACRLEVERLSRYVHEHMWNAETRMYCDRRLRTSDHVPEHSSTRSIGAYWTLLADAVAPERLPLFLEALHDPALFNRPVRTPALAATDASYTASGGYWNGGVWPPTNYMLLRGLTQAGQTDLAADIGANYVAGVTSLFEDTGTVWENMAPEFVSGRAAAGQPSKPDFCGWSGIGPVAVLLEYVFGIRPDVPRREIVWDVRLLDEFGVEQYPYGPDGTLSLKCAARREYAQEPVVTITSTVPVRLRLRWGGRACTEGGVDTRPAHAADVMQCERVIDVVPVAAGIRSDASSS